MQGVGQKLLAPRIKKSPPAPKSDFLIGPFFAVSKPILVTKGSFESSRRDLQDTHHSADLRTQNFSLKGLSKFAKFQIFGSKNAFFDRKLHFCYLQLRILTYEKAYFDRTVHVMRENVFFMAEICSENAGNHDLLISKN